MGNYTTLHHFPSISFDEQRNTNGLYTPVMYKFIILNVLFWHTNLLCIKMFCYIHYYMYTFTWSHLLLEATDFKEAISSKRKPLAPRSEWHRHLQVSSCLVLVIWVHMIRNNPGNAQVCLGLQAPMVSDWESLAPRWRVTDKESHSLLWHWLTAFLTT